MDEKVKKIQERLRKTFGQPMAMGERARSMPLIAFETVVEAPAGCEGMVDSVVEELASRGYRTARIARDDSHKTIDERLEELGEPADIYICEGFGYMMIPKIILSKRVEEGFNMGLPEVIGYVADQDAQAIIPRFKPGDSQAIVDFIEGAIIDGETVKRIRSSFESDSSLQAANVAL